VDFVKILTEHLHEEGYYVSYHKDKIKIRFGHENVSLYKKDDFLMLEEWVVSNNNITINNYPQMNVKRTKVGNIHDPRLFDVLFNDLNSRKRRAEEDSTKEVRNATRSGTVYRNEKPH
jgi:hypothetical protein